MIVAEQLVKRYGPVTALDGFDLTVAPGEIVGLIGHNGAGKTTFAEIVAGLVRPDAGRVEVTGTPGLSPQEPALYLPATVRQNLRLFAGLAGLHGRRLRAAVDEIATALRVTGLLDRPVGTLSGGQRRRVQAATAMVQRPAALLLDEPTVGADPASREALLQVVRDRAGDGAAVCYTTHYLPELDDLDATLAVAARGRVIARGPRARLLDGLPGHVAVRFAGPVPAALREQGTVIDGELHIPTTDPAATLGALLRDGHSPTGVDVRKPTLDDLYHALAVPPAVASPAGVPHV